MSDTVPILKMGKEITQTVIVKQSFTDKHAPLGQCSLAFYWVLVETKGPNTGPQLTIRFELSIIN